MTKTKLEVHESQPNIFADLDRPDADTHFLKAKLVAELYRLTGERKLTQTKAATLMGISQPEVSRLFKGHFREYSIERLLRFFTVFDRDIEIVSRPTTTTSLRGQITFKAATASPTRSLDTKSGR